MYLGRDLSQVGQHIAQRHRVGAASPQREIQIAVVLEQPIVDGNCFRLRYEDLVADPFAGAWHVLGRVPRACWTRSGRPGEPIGL